MPSPELERLVSDAVKELVQARRCSPVQSVRLPLSVRSDGDLAELLRWFKVLCASESLRDRFLSGAIELDLRLAPTAAPRAEAPTPRQAGASHGHSPIKLDEAVITEVALRQHRAAGRVVLLKPRAVVTPAARDYARTAGIRMERSSP